MRVVYFGSGAFSVPSLRAVLAGGEEVVGIFTQPARPAGRGGRFRPTPVAEAAREADREAVECADINDEASVAAIAALKPDVICVVDFGQLIGSRVLASAPLGAFNLHASLLPKLRGAAPINWALIRGHEGTGVTSFRVVREMDAGAVYLQAATDIGPEETAEQLKERLAAMGAEVVCRTLEMLADGTAAPTEQDHSQATFAPKLKKSDGIIDWSAGAEAVCNVIRGTWPWPGGQAVLHRSSGRDVAVTIAAAAAAPGGGGGQAGVMDEELFVSAGSGRVRIVRIRPAGKRIMDWRDFVNGYRVQPGDVFGRGHG